MKTILCRLLGSILLFTAAVCAAPAPTHSEKLQRAIYLEETERDLERAVAAYREIVEDEQALRASAAEAQYRLGTCLVKLGRKAEAIDILRSVLRRFPDEEQPVRRASARLEELGAATEEVTNRLVWQPQLGSAGSVSREGH
jgi:tetratricopeptide (TPR) repeat protein